MFICTSVLGVPVAVHTGVEAMFTTVSLLSVLEVGASVALFVDWFSGGLAFDFPGDD